MLLVSVIIPTYRDTERLLICLKALEGQSIGSDQFEVIVVNNDPSEKLELSMKGNLVVLQESVKSSYSARNMGIKNAKADILAFTDADCIPDKDWLHVGLSKFDADPQIMRIGGRVDLFFESPKLTKADCYELIYGFKQEQFVKDGKSVTANLFARKLVFDKVGDFNASLQSGGDMEWGLRAEKSGFAIAYDKDAVVKHPSRSEIKEVLIKAVRVSEGIFQKRKNKTLLASIMHLFVKLVPPIHELAYIRNKGHNLSISQRLSVFFLRYRIRVLREWSIFKAIQNS
jgi:glycosyltransferase involved in cell wall biosynthesis